MDLDRFKNKWKKMDIPHKEEPALDQQQLRKIIRLKYSKNIAKIAVPEILISILCLIGVVFFISFQHLLESGIHRIIANVGIVFLIAIPILSLHSIYQFSKVGKMMVSPSETLEAFKKQSKRYTKIQQVLMALNILLFAVCLVTVPLIYSENLTNEQLGLTFLIGFFLLFWLSKKVSKYYQDQIRKNEELIRQLDNEI